MGNPFDRWIGSLLTAFSRREEPALRLSPWQGVDVTFTGIIAGVFAFNFGVGQAIAMRPKLPEPEPLLEVIASGRLGKWLTLPEPAKEPAKPPEPKPAAPPRNARVATVVPARAPVSKAPSRKEMEEKARNSGILKVIGSKNSEALGAVTELFSESGLTVEQAIEDAQRNRTAGLVADEVVRRGGNEGRAVGIDALTTDGAARSQGIGERAMAAVPRVTFEEDVASSAPGCDGSAIARQIKNKLKLIQRCYESEIKRSPTLKGKVLVRLTIRADGKVGDVEIDEDSVGSANLARCIERNFRTWIFPSGGEECVVTHPFVFSPVQ